jgi:hypothetical protein
VKSVNVTVVAIVSAHTNSLYNPITVGAVQVYSPVRPLLKMIFGALAPAAGTKLLMAIIEVIFYSLFNVMV